MVEGIGLGIERVAEILRQDDRMPTELLDLLKEAGWPAASRGACQLRY